MPRLTWGWLTEHYVEKLRKPRSKAGAARKRFLLQACVEVVERDEAPVTRATLRMVLRRAAQLERSSLPKGEPLAVRLFRASSEASFTLFRAIGKISADVCTVVDAVHELMCEDAPLVVGLGVAALVCAKFMEDEEKAPPPDYLVTSVEARIEGLSAVASVVLASAHTVLGPSLTHVLDSLERTWLPPTPKRPAPPARPGSAPAPKRARAAPPRVNGSELQRSEAGTRRPFSEYDPPIDELLLRFLTDSAGRERELIVANRALAEFNRSADFMRLALERYDAALGQVRPLLAIVPVPVLPAYAPAELWLGLTDGRTACFINIAGDGRPGGPRTLPSITWLKYTMIHELAHHKVFEHSIEFARQIEWLVRRLALSAVPAAKY
ncbi:hypothetical protein T492DRAFT_1112045 [Pavlovales sp. CCMP2436]|nr:hypothetical protein T492DRAFT_1112045 [Pavlovales sp. CCMP2436]